jgi:hypothetical protein
VRCERGRIDAGCDAARFQQHCQSQEKCETKKPSPKLHFTIPGRTRPICCLVHLSAQFIGCKSLAKSRNRRRLSCNCPIVGDLCPSAQCKSTKLSIAESAP